MEIYCVTFAGHRNIDQFSDVEKALDKAIINLLHMKEFIEFYIGNDGDFDIMAASAIRRVKKQYGLNNYALNLVLPYRKAHMDLLESQFDSVIVPEELHGLHPKSAITARNRWMVNHSDLLICHITRSTGGAATTLNYAKKILKGILYI